MTYQLIDSAYAAHHSPIFLEGAIYAANLAVTPLPVEQWPLDNLDQALVSTLEAQFHSQYSHLMANAYSLAQFIDVTEREQLVQFAEGFFTLWPLLEEKWQAVEIGDGSMRMLQALFTTLMMAMDEEGTLAQLREAGIDHTPSLSELTANIDMMLVEVANTASDLQIGNKSVKVNPYKSVGRNDSCPCGSGKKFKQCCL